MGAHRKAIVKTIQTLAYGRHTYQVFEQFLEMTAVSISNAVTLQSAEWQEREDRYLRIASQYKPEELGQVTSLLGMLTLELEEAMSDVLGPVYHELELHNKWAGQFFSPYSICQMMAKMTVGTSDPHGLIVDRGYLTACEPCAGSGAMVIALAEELRAQGINYQQSLHVTACDIDLKCVHMTYLQLSLLNVPAVVLHTNSLGSESPWSAWYTPAHILGGWSWKLRRQQSVVTQEHLPPPIEQVVLPPPPPPPVVQQLTLF